MKQTQMKATAAADIQSIDRMILDHDCATVAMHVLNSINNNTMKYSSENMSTQDTEVAHQVSILSQSTQTSSVMFIECISSILSCSCSTKENRGCFVAAAACNSFQGQFEPIVYYIKILSSPRTSPKSNGSGRIPKGEKEANNSTGMNIQGNTTPQDRVTEGQIMIVLL